MSEMSGKMAIVGDGDSIMLFRAVGVSTFKVDNGVQAKDTLRKIAKDYSVIFLTEQFANDVKDLLKMFDEKTYPVVLTVPSKNGATEEGINILKQAMERALGVDILFNKD